MLYATGGERKLGNYQPEEQHLESLKITITTANPFPDVNQVILI